MRSTTLRWAGPASTLVAVIVTAAVAGLMVWTVLPLAMGWRPSVILTGSMMPRVHPGDIVVTRPVPPEKLRVKHVIRFADPSHPGRYLLHRIAYVRPDRTLITRGDANQSADSTPVPLGNVDGVAVLRVPYVGLPIVWMRNGEYGSVGIAAVLAFVTAFGLTRRPDDDEDKTEGIPAAVAAGTP